MLLRFLLGFVMIFAIPLFADDFSDTIEGARQIQLNHAVNGRLERGGDKDVFKIVLPSSGRLAIGTAGNTDTYGELLDSSGNVIAQNDDKDSNDRNFRIIAQNLAAGTYYIRVKGYDSTITGAYRLAVFFRADDGDSSHDSGSVNSSGASSSGARVNLNYPTVFVHGLYSSDDTWADMIEYIGRDKFGGVLQPIIIDHLHILAPGGAYPAANLRSLTIDSLDIRILGNGLKENKKLYSIEFPDSNDLSFTMQGLLLKYAIQKVKELTNSQKVNLVTHSMGGLAARAYMEFFYQNDVNLLMTIGTPHDGAYLAAASGYLGISGITGNVVPQLAKGSPDLELLNGHISRLPSDVKYFTIAAYNPDDDEDDILDYKRRRDMNDSNCPYGITFSPYDPAICKFVTDNQSIYDDSDNVVPYISQSWLYLHRNEIGSVSNYIFTVAINSSPAHMNETNNRAVESIVSRVLGFREP